MSAPLAVRWWPGVAPAAREGLVLVGVRGNGDRGQARLAIRRALCEAVGSLAGVAAPDVALLCAPGHAPRVALPPTAQLPAPRISISHDGALSVAAISLSGPVGVDLMAHRAIPDWRALAADYLGPAALARLAAIPAPLRAVALAREWTVREARLKCLGLQLAEWSAQCPSFDAGLACRELDLPAGYAGAVAFPATAAGEAPPGPSR